MGGCVYDPLYSMAGLFITRSIFRPPTSILSTIVYSLEGRAVSDERLMRRIYPFTLTDEAVQSQGSGVEKLGIRT